MLPGAADPSRGEMHGDGDHRRLTIPFSPDQVAFFKRPIDVSLCPGLDGGGVRAASNRSGGRSQCSMAGDESERPRARSHALAVKSSAAFVVVGPSPSGDVLEWSACPSLAQGDSAATPAGRGRSSMPTMNVQGSGGRQKPAWRQRSRCAGQCRNFVGGMRPFRTPRNGAWAASVVALSQAPTECPTRQLRLNACTIRPWRELHGDTNGIV